MNKSRCGENNSNWKGNQKISERAKHYRIVSKKGKASDYTCQRCKKNKAHDWADMGNGKYIPLCRSCHNKEDKKIKNIQLHDSRYKNLKEELISISQSISEQF